MGRFVILLLMILLGSCRQSIKKEDLQLLNGYWEIDRVKASDGKEKTYALNTTIDYLQLNGMKGFRKKVQPRTDGTFATSDDAVRFSILRKSGAYYMVYEGEDSEWTEQLLQLKASAFSVVNEDQFTYYYKRYKAPEIKP